MLLVFIFASGIHAAKRHVLIIKKGIPEEIKAWVDTFEPKYTGGPINVNRLIYRAHGLGSGGSLKRDQLHISILSILSEHVNKHGLELYEEAIKKAVKDIEPLDIAKSLHLSTRDDKQLKLSLKMGSRAMKFNWIVLNFIDKKELEALKTLRKEIIKKLEEQKLPYEKMPVGQVSYEKMPLENEFIPHISLIKLPKHLPDIEFLNTKFPKEFNNLYSKSDNIDRWEEAFIKVLTNRTVHPWVTVPDKEIPIDELIFEWDDEKDEQKKATITFSFSEPAGQAPQDDSYRLVIKKGIPKEIKDWVKKRERRDSENKELLYKLTYGVVQKGGWVNSEQLRISILSIPANEIKDKKESYMQIIKDVIKDVKSFDIGKTLWSTLTRDNLGAALIFSEDVSGFKWILLGINNQNLIDLYKAIITGLKSKKDFNFDEKFAENALIPHISLIKLQEKLPYLYDQYKNIIYNNTILEGLWTWNLLADDWRKFTSDAIWIQAFKWYVTWLPLPQISNENIFIDELILEQGEKEVAKFVLGSLGSASTGPATKISSAGSPGSVPTVLATAASTTRKILGQWILSKAQDYVEVSYDDSEQCYFGDIKNSDGKLIAEVACPLKSSKTITLTSGVSGALPRGKIVNSIMAKKSMDQTSMIYWNGGIEFMFNNSEQKWYIYHSGFSGDFEFKQLKQNDLVELKKQDLKNPLDFEKEFNALVNTYQPKNFYFKFLKIQPIELNPDDKPFPEEIQLVLKAFIEVVWEKANNRDSKLPLRAVSTGPLASLQAGLVVLKKAVGALQEKLTMVGQKLGELKKKLDGLRSSKG